MERAPTHIVRLALAGPVSVTETGRVISPQLIGLLAVLALLAFWLVQRALATHAMRAGMRLRKQRRGLNPSGRPEVPPAAPGTEQFVSPETAPASLRDFDWHTAQSLPESRKQRMLAELKKTPPPPRAFHQLVSPEFVANASSAELADLVIGVPRAATTVLARVNSAFYGLPRPVGSVGQAITFLGLNSVRTICLQYMMEASFNACAPALRQRFDQLCAASAIAVEVSQKLSQRLQLAEAGSLVTEVALSSLGHFAAATLMPRAAAASNQSLLARAWSEQEQLGAPAAEIGALLMRAWELPEVLVQQVRAIDRMLVMPAAQLEPEHRLRLTVGYLSARLGERMARGETVNPEDFALTAMTGDDFFHVRAGLETGERQRLHEALRSPELARSLRSMIAALRQPDAG